MVTIKNSSIKSLKISTKILIIFFRILKYENFEVENIAMIGKKRINRIDDNISQVGMNQRRLSIDKE